MKLTGWMVLVCVLCRGWGAGAQTERAEKLPPATLPLQLTLATNKSVYLTGEPVVLDVQVRNPEHRKEITGVFSLGSDFFFEVFNAQGQRVRLDTPGGSADSDGRVSFGPVAKSSDDYVATSLDLMYGDVAMVSERFRAAAPVTGRKVRKYFLVPGKYTINAGQGIYEKEAQRFLKSTPVEFEVREPNEREKLALELFEVRPVPFWEFWRDEEWDKLHPERKRLAFDNWRETRATYRKLYNTYPDTPYASYALYYCGRLSQEMGEWQNAADSYGQLLRETPEFPLRADALYFLANCHLKLGQKAQARKDFQRLQEPNTTRLVTPTITYYEHPTRMEKLERDVKGN